MKVPVLFGQRKERYEGEYAPECLAVMSETDDSDNPDYLRDEKRKADESGEFERTEVITLVVSWNDVMARLRPAQQPISAAVS